MNSSTRPNPIEMWHMVRIEPEPRWREGGALLAHLHLSYWPIYTVRFLLTIRSHAIFRARAVRVNFHDIKSPVATIAVGLKNVSKGHDNKRLYYSTITSFYHIRTRERAKYESVLHCSKRIAL